MLPRIQEQFSISESLIGIFASAFFAGMALGAFGWGSLADRIGRLPVFNITLLWTTIFGIAVGFAPNFPVACVLVGILGIGVGGNSNCSQKRFY